MVRSSMFPMPNYRSFIYPNSPNLKLRTDNSRYWWNRPNSSWMILLDRIRTILEDRPALYLTELASLLDIPGGALSSALTRYVRSGFLARQSVTLLPSEVISPFHNSLWLYCLPKTLPPCRVKEPASHGPRSRV